MTFGSLIGATRDPRNLSRGKGIASGETTLYLIPYKWGKGLRFIDVLSNCWYSRSNIKYPVKKVISQIFWTREEAYSERCYNSEEMLQEFKIFGKNNKNISGIGNSIIIAMIIILFCFYSI